MYGAKASAITKAALATWAPGKSPTEKTTRVVTETVMAIAALGRNTAFDLKDLPEAKAGFPDILRHREFVNLVHALADNPLVH